MKHLSSAYESYIGRGVSRDDLAKIVDNTSETYRAAGFHLSRAIIPPQDVASGELRIDIIEGHFTELSLKGDAADQFGVPISLSGSGTFSPIQQGKPHAPTVERIPVPRNGFTAPRQAMNERGVQLTRQSSGHSVKSGGSRISSPIGAVRLDVSRVTNGLARDNGAAPSGGPKNESAKALTGGSESNAGTNSQGNGSAGGMGAASTSVSISATIAASSGADGSPKGNDKGKDKGKDIAAKVDHPRRRL